MVFEWIANTGVYQSLVAVNPLTLIAQICNLFIQLFLAKKLFLDKIKAILDQRREAADKEITTAEAAKAEALAIKETYEQNMQQARAQANEILDRAQKTATARGEDIIRQANQEAAQLKQKAATDIAMEKKKALNDAKDEISGVAMAIAEKVVERQLDSSDHDKLINQFIEKLG
ncbi:MAG: F0F1 ATP synthase subunit B [Oscillospiraceae bacterium]|nr:F0F1 ATP synthase subunit B [Oscillospiraceae bacterium]